MYNFTLLGNCLSFNIKIRKHINENNPERVKDYLCSAFNTFDPNQYKNHPCIENIMDGVKYIKSQGWKAFIGEWKEIGKQMIIISPDKKFYHSNYIHRNKQQSAV